MSQISFGTDGWRAIVGEDFTPENIERVIQAFCDLYPKLAKTGKHIVIGYD
ncbi:MAG: phosphoglucomutase/phosphomannomutase family protein, partial [Deltaproteobacteria bacterium]|nr:phosphoglucomutase/phosphomannomutase family protein [Deltaproteobacteria bacterium]